jgi:DNA-binding transcriptional ArsR family regulator
MSAALKIIRDTDQAVALLSPVRLRMLECLSEPDSAAGVARRMDLPRQQANYHLRELEKCGLVEPVEERRKGNCIERVVRATAQQYLISPEVLGALGQAPDTAADRLSSAYLVAAAARVVQDVAVLRERAEQAGKPIATLTLETEVCFANAADRAAFAEELAAEFARLAAKYHTEGAPGGNRTRVIAGAYPVITKRAEH